MRNRIDSLELENFDEVFKVQKDNSFVNKNFDEGFEVERDN